MTAVVNLLPGVPHRVLHGHPWVFSNEVKSIDGTYSPGDIVEIRSPGGKFVALGYINPNSAILVRLLSREDRAIDRGFFRERLQSALEYRRTLFGVQSFAEDERGFRLVFSEADFLPGLVVDIFGGYLVFQTLTLGIDKWKETIIDLLAELVSPKGIYERNDAPVRELEGLDLVAGYVGKPFNPLVEMVENGVRVLVDVQKGQKTGYFLDQSANRLALRPFVKGKTVLDAFSYSGGFGLSAMVGGAEEVLCLDVSEAALDMAKASAELNGFRQKMRFRAGNAFDVLRELESKGASFDVVVLDPPAFARSRKMVERALAGYKEINLRAMRILKPGGFLCTSSCSHHVTKEEFDAMLLDAARDAGKYLRIVESRGQRSDHPILSGVPETEYLKFRLCQVLPRH
ncbi:MAG TPA: class I SAM-dependent rRNA methyltransferase [Firmicutes bacterium]|nr:class I SAM-dependent rRNA methyltransferase [Candidatus Fermentithermobacillaceae bacterium]